MKYGSLFVIIFMLATTGPMLAESIQTLDAIKATAERYARVQASRAGSESDLQIQAGELDPRLRLPSCDSALVAFSPPGSRLIGNTTVGVKCASPKAWSVYIPVRIALLQEVVVVKRPVRRGDMILPEDVGIERIDTAQLRGIPFQSLQPVIGSKAKQMLSTGTILDSANVCVVCKGDNVSITVANTSISVAMSGIALSDGSVGDSIRVQNSASKRIIEAIVVNEDTVKAGI